MSGRPGQKLIAHLDGLSPEERERAFARGAQYLRDAGVFVRQYGDGKSPRDWPLSPVPVIQPEAEWQALAEGGWPNGPTCSRRLSPISMAKNRLVAEGHLPASVIASNPEWLRPLVGVKPRIGSFPAFRGL